MTPLMVLVEEANFELMASERLADQFVATCMRELGFEYVLGDIEAPIESLGETSARLDAAEARVLGYHGVMSLAGGINPIETENRLSGLSEEDVAAWGLALFGSEDSRIAVDFRGGVLEVPGEGCLAEGRLAAAGEVTIEAQAIHASLQAMSSESYSLVQSDPRTVTLQLAWSECMAEDGYVFGTPSEAIEWIADSPAFDVSGPSQAEIQLAEHDAACRASLDYETVLSDSRNRADVEVLARNQDVVLAWQELRVTIHERNRELLPPVLFEDR